MINKILDTYLPVLEHKKRYYLIAGGRAGGRSYFASQYASARLLDKSYFRCAIMRYVLGDVRNSIYQEIIDRLEEGGIQNYIDIKEHSLTINYNQNTINGVGFRKSSGDQKSKLKSLANYNCVIIEEADETNEEDFQQLDDSLRTIKTDIIVILLFNMPDKRHWIMRRWFNLIDTDVESFYKAELKDSEKHNTEFIFSTFEDNEINLNKSTIDNFLRYEETKPDHYWNMVKGLVPDGKRGRVFKNWLPITDKEFQELPYTPFYGLDFGYSCDPATLTEIKMHNDNVYVKQIIYEVGLLNIRLSEKMTLSGISKDSEIVADSAEPKSIDEMKSYEWNIIPAQKGNDSIRNGVNLLQGKNVFYTEESVKIIEEVQNYTWQLDKNKEPTNEPIDDYNHSIDGIRYGVSYKVNIKEPNIRWL